MRDWTGIEIREERERLEREAATLLGYMLFEYSRLDMALGLLLAWADGGKNLEAASEKLGRDNFHSKLGALQKVVRAEFSGTPETKASYEALINDAHRVRELRNTLFHGRWGFDAMEQVAVCVTGLPASPSQREARYTISDLEGMLESMRSLRGRLHDLAATKCP
jgi:hypothetical protein